MDKIISVQKRYEFKNGRANFGLKVTYRTPKGDIYNKNVTCYDESRQLRLYRNLQKFSDNQPPEVN